MKTKFTDFTRKAMYNASAELQKIDEKIAELNDKREDYSSKYMSARLAELRAERQRVLSAGWDALQKGRVAALEALEAGNAINPDEIDANLVTLLHSGIRFTPTEYAQMMQQNEGNLLNQRAVYDAACAAGAGKDLLPPQTADNVALGIENFTRHCANALEGQSDYFSCMLDEDVYADASKPYDGIEIDV